MIQTTLGEMDEALLERRDIVDENEDAKNEITEYWYYGECVRRDAHVKIKKSVSMFCETSSIT